MEITSADSSVRPVDESEIESQKAPREESVKEKQPSAPPPVPEQEVLPTAPDYMGNNIDTNA